MRRLVHFPSVKDGRIELVNNAMDELSIPVFNAIIDILKSLDCLFGFIEQLVQFAGGFSVTGLRLISDNV